MQPEDVVNHYEEKVVGATPRSVLREERPTMKRIADVMSVKRLLPKIKSSYAYVRDCVEGKRINYSKAALNLIVGGLAYLALPNDIVPDFIPTVGWLDDVVVLEWIFRQLGSEFEKDSSKDGKEIF